MERDLIISCLFCLQASASLLIGCKVIKVKAKTERYVVSHLFSYFWCKSTFFLFINNNDDVFFEGKLYFLFFEVIFVEKIRNQKGFVFCNGLPFRFVRFHICRQLYALQPVLVRVLFLSRR